MKKSITRVKKVWVAAEESDGELFITDAATAKVVSLKVTADDVKEIKTKTRQGNPTTRPAVRGVVVASSENFVVVRFGEKTTVSVTRDLIEGERVPAAESAA